MTSASFIQKIADAGLLGRGCGTFPVSRKWQAVLGEKKWPKYVVCNAAESEPGIFKDKFILENYPEKVLDGIKIAMRLIRAERAFIYLNPHYRGDLEKKLLLLIGRDKIEIFCNPRKGYIGGEEGAILNVMEGEREEARLKPPFITESGLFGQPTLLNNCETFYDISLISQAQYANERFFCFSGKDTPQNVSLLPENMTVKEALVKSGHWPTFPFFVQLGGAMSGICLRPDQLSDYQIKYYSGLVIRPLNGDENKMIQGWLDFFAAESCGKCVPCREGTYRLRQLFAGGKTQDPLFADIIFSMNSSAVCSLARMAVSAIVSYFENIKKISFPAANSLKKCF